MGNFLAVSIFACLFLLSFGLRFPLSEMDWGVIEAERKRNLWVRHRSWLREKGLETQVSPNLAMLVTSSRRETGTCGADMLPRNKDDLID
jgi:hypothetical protein